MFRARRLDVRDVTCSLLPTLTITSRVACAYCFYLITLRSTILYESATDQMYNVVDASCR
jgi:hypothetical protein